MTSTPDQSQRGTDERERLADWLEMVATQSDDGRKKEPNDKRRLAANMLRADAEQLRALEQRLEAYKLLDSGSLSEQACAWEMVAATLSEITPDWHSLSNNGTDAACLAIRQLRARDEEIAALRKDAKRLNYLDGLRWSSWNQTPQSTDNIKTNVAWMIVSPNVGCVTIREAIDELQDP